jgi:hypothetical protein
MAAVDLVGILKRFILETHVKRSHYHLFALITASSAFQLYPELMLKAIPPKKW